MKDRGELGCALLVVVALVALLVLADVTSDDVLMASDEPGGFTAWRVATLNRMRRVLNKPPMWQVPKTGVTFEERQLVKQATRLAADISSALRTSSAPISDRALIQQQAD